MNIPQNMQQLQHIAALGEMLKKAREEAPKRVAGLESQILTAVESLDLTQPPSIEELAQQAVEHEAEQIRLQNRIEELRAAHPDIPTPEQP